MIRPSDTSDILSPKGGDIIVLKVGSDATREDIESRLRSLRKALDELGHTDVGIVVVGHFDDIRLLRSSDMRKLGWIRVER